MKEINYLALGVVIGIAATCAMLDRAPAVEAVPAVAAIESEVGVDPTIPQDAETGGTAAPENSDATAPAAAVEPTSDAPAAAPLQPEPSIPLLPGLEAGPSLRDAIHDYERQYGVRWFVSGMTEQQHLIQTHGWHADQLVGLTEDELHLLHGASHTGRLNPRDFAVDGMAENRPSIASKSSDAKGHDAVDDSRVKVRILSPATWDCPHCPGHRDQDWKAAGIDAEFVKQDGLPRYPCTEWTDSRGVTRRLYGRRTPQAVLWSYKKTIE